MICNWNFVYFFSTLYKYNVTNISRQKFRICNERSLTFSGSKNLFNRAIAQSGSIYGGLCLAPNSAEKAARQGLFFADYVGCGHESQSLQCLQNLTIEEIGFVPFLPRGSVDGVLSENPVLPEEPALLFESGEFHRVPLLLGTTDLEGILAGDIIFGLLGISGQIFF